MGVACILCALLKNVLNRLVPATNCNASAELLGPYSCPQCTRTRSLHFPLPPLPLSFTLLSTLQVPFCCVSHAHCFSGHVGVKRCLCLCESRGVSVSGVSVCGCEYECECMWVSVSVSICTCLGCVHAFDWQLLLPCG